MKSISSYRFAQKTFKHIAWSERWVHCFGTPERGASVLVYGASGNGKTEFCCQFSSEIAKHGKVMYISREQGASSSLQKAFARNGLLRNKNIRLVEEATLAEMKEIIKRRSRPSLLVLDSLDVLRLTSEQVRELMEVSKKRTMILFVARADGRKPNKQAGVDAMYDSDIKIHVRKYVAFGESRFGGGDYYVVFEEKAKKEHHFLNI